MVIYQLVTKEWDNFSLSREAELQQSKYAYTKSII